MGLKFQKWTKGQWPANGYLDCENLTKQFSFVFEGFFSPEAYLNIFILKYNICIFEGYFFSSSFVSWVYRAEVMNGQMMELVVLFYGIGNVSVQNTRLEVLIFFPFPLFLSPNVLFLSIFFSTSAYGSWGGDPSQWSGDQWKGTNIQVANAKIREIIDVTISQLASNMRCKGRVGLPNLMNIRKQSKRPSTVPPSFSENYVANFL